jgi:multicomponent Na+:H+ antiporter subunit E
MLLTSDFSVSNSLIGLAGAVVVSGLPTVRFTARQLLCLMGATLALLPQALVQSCAMVLRSHDHEVVTPEPLRRPEDPWGAFHQVFLITFTPKTLVISHEEAGRVQVHSLERKECS